MQLNHALWLDLINSGSSTVTENDAKSVTNDVLKSLEKDGIDLALLEQ